MDKQQAKRGRGRPVGTKKEKTGAMVWIQAEYLDTVKAFLETLKAQQKQTKP